MEQKGIFRNPYFFEIVCEISSDVLSETVFEEVGVMFSFSFHKVGVFVQILRVKLSDVSYQIFINYFVSYSLRI